MREINFLQHRRKKLTKLQERDRHYLQLAAILFIIIFSLAAAVVFARIFYSRRYQNILSSQQNVEQEILSQESVEKDFIVMMSKIAVLKKIYDQRQDKQQAINYFSTIFGPQVLIKQIEYAGNDNLLTFVLSADNVFVMDRVFAILNSEEIKNKYAQVTPSNLHRLESGEYQINVAVVLREKK